MQGFAKNVADLPKNLCEIFYLLKIDFNLGNFSINYNA